MNASSLSPILRRLIAPALLIAGALTVYHGCLGPGIITAGDWIPTPQARMLDFWPAPSLWNPSIGLGGPDVFGLTFFPANVLYGLMARVGIDYTWAERLIYVFPAILVASTGGYIFSMSLFRNNIAAIISGLFLVCNSYIVIIDGGGQFTVGVAYAFIPLILWSFRTALRSDQGFRYLLTASFIAMQGTYDLRLTYLTIAMLVLYAPFISADLASCVRIRIILARLVKQACISLIVEVLVQAPWLLPTLLVKGYTPALPQGYSSIDELRFLSFMLLSNSIVLMHAFWPLNELGHVALLDPLFFAFPLLSFGILLKTRLQRDVQYLLLLSIVTVFFVKGDNPPAGVVYDWLFLHVPGFSWFRDPSKFYQPLMVGMAVLFGLAVVEGGRWIKQHVPHKSSFAMVTLWTVAGLAAAIYPALPGIMTGRAGTLILKHMPAEFVRLNAMIEEQHEYFRVLWFPGWTRFGTFSELHPRLDAATIGTTLYTTSQLPNANPYSWLALSSAQSLLEALSVKYVVVPSDPLHDLYAVPNGPATTSLTYAAALTLARRYFRGFHEFSIGANRIFTNPSFLPLAYIPSRVFKQNTPSVSPSIPFLSYVSRNGNVASAIYSATVASSGASTHVRPLTYNMSSRSLPLIHVHRESTTQIKVDVRGAAQPFVLLFLQSYDPNWRAYIVPRGASFGWSSLWHAHALSQSDHLLGNGYGNAWLIRVRGSYSIGLIYWPQVLVAVGGIVCWLTIIGSMGYVLYALRRDAKRGRQHGSSPTPAISLPVAEGQYAGSPL